jgi:hypothetical protein
MSPELIYQAISVVLIPIIVALARKFTFPAKWAPILAFGIAVVLTSVAKFFNIDLDVNTISSLIITALATAGISVLGYDAVRKLTQK